MDPRLREIQRAYDRTVEEHREGIDPLDAVPGEFLRSAHYRALSDARRARGWNSGSPEARAFLDPRPGSRFLDAGCGANLANYRLDRWPSTYHGVDVSAALVTAMRAFVAAEKLGVGGLVVAELARLPFAADCFVIAAAIGVFEYLDLAYCDRALGELARVLAPGGRLVLDVANTDHPHAETLFRLEAFLGRPHRPKARAAFEALVAGRFHIARHDDADVMAAYFLERR